MPFWITIMQSINEKGLWIAQNYQFLVIHKALELQLFCRQRNNLIFWNAEYCDSTPIKHLKEPKAFAKIPPLLNMRLPLNFPSVCIISAAIAHTIITNFNLESQNPIWHRSYLFLLFSLQSIDLFFFNCHTVCNKGKTL